MADASDSKSDEGDLVWVQVPSPAVKTLNCVSGSFILHVLCNKQFQRSFLLKEVSCYMKRPYHTNQK